MYPNNIIFYNIKEEIYNIMNSFDQSPNRSPKFLDLKRLYRCTLSIFSPAILIIYKLQLFSKLFQCIRACFTIQKKWLYRNRHQGYHLLNKMNSSKFVSLFVHHYLKLSLQFSYMILPSDE